MSTPNGNTLKLLVVADNNGSVTQAIEAAGAVALEVAEGNGYIRVAHRTSGVVAARWAAWTASADQQADDLTVQITPDGLEHLERAR